MRSDISAPEIPKGLVYVASRAIRPLRAFIIAFFLVYFMAATSSAMVSLTEKQNVLKQQEKRHNQMDTLLKSTGSMSLIDGSGVKWFINTDITFNTTSSASGAMSEASYTHPVAATTAGGGTVMATLNDSFDGYNTVCISLTGATGPCETGNPSYTIYNRNGPATTELGGRQVVFNNQQIGPLQVSRKVYVPESDSFARWLNIVTNTGAVSQSFTLITSNNLGSDSNTIITGTSNGSTTPTLSDTWVATMQNYSGNTSSDPRLAHVLQGPGAIFPLSRISFQNGDDNPFWNYQITLDPGETAIVMNFAVVQPSKAAAAQKAAQLVSLPANAIYGMTAQEVSEVVNFVTHNNSILPALQLLLLGNEPPILTGPPQGPASGLLNQVLSYTAQATAPEGGSVMYLFDWGDGTMSDWLSTGTEQHSWSQPGDYCVRVKARDADPSESAWTDCTSVHILENQPPVLAGPPQGPATGLLDQVLSYTAQATDPEGGSVMYRFDWGDGTMSDWLSTGASQHSWSQSGDFCVKVKARDASQLESAWTACTSVNILENQAPDFAGPPQGPASGLLDQVLSYTAQATDPEGGSVMYRFDWGDGTMSDWLSTGAAQHSWSQSGNFCVKVKARDPRQLESAWTTCTSVHILENQPPVLSGPPQGPASGLLDQVLSYTAQATDPEGGTVMYRFDWGDGTTSDWLSTGAAQHAWSQSGDFCVKVKARDPRQLESAWTTCTSVHILENQPPVLAGPPQGPATGLLDHVLSYTAQATDPEGGSVMYRFDWGDGTTSDWLSTGAAQHAWSQSGDFCVKVKARDARQLESAWTACTSVHIPENQPPVLAGPPQGPASGLLEQVLSFTAQATDPEGGSVMYRFDWGDGTMSDWLSSGAAQHSWSQSGDHCVKVKARDARLAESAWTACTNVHILENQAPVIVGPPQGPVSGLVKQPLSFTAQATDPEGGSVMYLFDWGDGTTSGWITTGDAQHMWYRPGDYCVRVKVRDASLVESAWTACTTVHILVAEAAQLDGGQE